MNLTSKCNVLKHLICSCRPLCAYRSSSLVHRNISLLFRSIVSALRSTISSFIPRFMHLTTHKEYANRNSASASNWTQSSSIHSNIPGQHLIKSSEHLAIIILQQYLDLRRVLTLRKHNCVCYNTPYTLSVSILFLTCLDLRSFCLPQH